MNAKSSDIDLPRSDEMETEWQIRELFRPQSGETAAQQVRRIREVIVSRFPKADPTRETLR